MLNSAGIKGLQGDVRDLKFMKNAETLYIWFIQIVKGTISLYEYKYSKIPLLEVILIA